MSKFLDLFKKKHSVSNLQSNKSHSSVPYTPKKQQAEFKINIVNVFNHEEEVKRLQRFQELLQADVVDLQQLKSISWNGIPQRNSPITTEHRSTCWKILLKYSPTNNQHMQQSLTKKRKDYLSMVDTYIQKPTLQQDAQQRKIYKLINDDVLRTLPQTNLFRQQIIQKMMRRYDYFLFYFRILYVWHIRHPSSGYVQGINDIVTPFLIVFLGQVVRVGLDGLDVPQGLGQIQGEVLEAIQADSYWCLCKILDRILDNYTSSWPGIEKSFGRMKQILKRVDPQLLQHFQNQGIDFYHMYFKWITCLLLRQFSVKIGLRLFDTFIADQSNYFNFMMYFLAAIILKYSKKFKKMKFQEMMIFQQNMPTKEWSQEDLATVIAEAYVYQTYFTK